MTFSRLTTIACMIGLTGIIYGCTTILRSDVVTFHEGMLPAGETIRVEAIDPELGQSLEFRRYAVLINKALEEIGYTPVQSFDEKVDLIA